MANLNPLRPYIASLTEKSQQIVERTATSFTVSRANEKTHTISLSCFDKDNHTHTTFYLLFQTVTEKNESIAAFLKTDLCSWGLAHCDRIKPIITTDRATVELRLIFPEDLDNLENYAKDLIPNGWSLERRDDRTVHLRHNVVQDKESQKAFLQKELPNLVKKLSYSYSLDEMLSLNEDPEFPGDLSYVDRVCSLWEDCLDSSRRYQLGPDGIFEKIDLPYVKTTFLPLTAPQEVEDWLADPASQKGKAMEKCIAVFKKEFKAALGELSTSEEASNKIAQMSAAARHYPEFEKAVREVTEPITSNHSTPLTLVSSEESKEAY